MAHPVMGERNINMDISSFNGRTAEIIILSADTYLKEGLFQMIAEAVKSPGPQRVHRGQDNYRISLTGQTSCSPDSGNILLLDERIFTDPSRFWEILSARLTDDYHMVIIITGGRPHYCGDHYLNIRLSLGVLAQNLPGLLCSKEAYRLNLNEILSPLNANQKILLSLLVEGCTLEEATLRMNCSIKTLYHMRKQLGWLLGVNTLSEMHHFMWLYRFMMNHESRYPAVRKIQSAGQPIIEKTDLIKNVTKHRCSLTTAAD